MSLTIRSRDGLALEAALDAPGDAKAVLVLCHPHPQMGGTMNAPLLLALRDEMVRREWAVVRFNFRGIGSSEGDSSTGIAEVADAGGAADFAAERFPSVPRAVAGWSFGAAVAVRLAAAEPGYVGCVAIAPAVTEKPGVTAGLPAADELGLSLPVLVVVGENDSQVSPDECSAWGAGAGARVERIAGANHFFWAKYDDLSELVGTWLDEKLEKGASTGFSREIAHDPPRVSDTGKTN
ncbi:MAG: alpha/beta fold hydrolase [Actinomycetota bacterium]|nr:alpha/beta fold hydrolase [Actinomycetota bacterium]